MRTLADISVFESLMNGSTASGNASFARVKNIGILYRGPKSTADLFKEAHKLKELMVQAEQGDPKSQVELGTRYKLGNGVVKDSKKATEWFRKAAEQGDSTGQKYLGWSYWIGDGVRQSNSEAQKWLNKAGEHDETANYHADLLRTFRKAESGKTPLTKDEMSDLGFGYFEGEFLERDPEKARDWFTKAAEQGDEVSKTFLERNDIIETRVSQLLKEARPGSVEERTIQRYKDKLQRMLVKLLT